jgi:hypothetical protein
MLSEVTTGSPYRWIVFDSVGTVTWKSYWIGQYGIADGGLSGIFIFSFVSETKQLLLGDWQ